MDNLPSLNLTVSILLIVYGVYLCAFTFFALFNLYNLIRYGYANYTLYLLVTVFLGGTIIIAATTILQLSTYDWSYPLGMPGLSSSSNNDLFPGL